MGLGDSGRRVNTGVALWRRRAGLLGNNSAVHCAAKLRLKSHLELKGLQQDISAAGH